MIVRISIFDTIINLYKPYIMDNCIKIVSKIQFLTFGDGVKINKELSLCDLALYLSCLGRIRTLTGGTRIRRATITPQGNFMSVKGGKIRLDDETSKRHVFLCLMTCRYKLFALFPFDGAKVGVIFESYKYFLIFFMDVR